MMNRKDNVVAFVLFPDQARARAFAWLFLPMGWHLLMSKRDGRCAWVEYIHD